MLSDNVITRAKCFHCGDDCPDETIFIGDKPFCCLGCKSVYEILNGSNLCNYYSIYNTPGISPKILPVRRFDYLDEPQTIQKLLDFQDENISSVTLFIPDMHCSSCIWLLENLFKLNPAINQSKVDFLRKKLSVRFFHNKISLKELVQLLASIGYEPQINLDSIDEKQDVQSNKKLYYKLGVAAFSFGNIMLLSFPEYLSIDVTETAYRKLFGYLNLLLALPVFFYSSSDYFISAFKGLRKRIINLDVPLALGIIALFSRSAYEVLTLTGPGYFDSLAGLLFFLLLGKLFQSKTYQALNFERNYKAYFPLSVIVKKDRDEKSVSLSELKPGDRVLIRSNEIIPADSVLISGDAHIDYSFVTGESTPVNKKAGDLIYAGGKQTGAVVELEVIKEVSQSYLTRLWNNETFRKPSESFYTQFSNTVSKYFTLVILAIGFIAAAFWLSAGVGMAVWVLTAVLIIACPCALAMSTPFTLGNILRVFGRNNFYVKNTYAVENLSKINEIVFDKTGTITKSGNSKINFIGDALTDEDAMLIKSVTRNSTHPLSKQLFHLFDCAEINKVDNFTEIKGEGISAKVKDFEIRIGSEHFIRSGRDVSAIKRNFDTRVFYAVNDSVRGFFKISNSYREGIESTVKNLAKKINLSLLSGDNEGEKINLKKIFGEKAKLKFNQSPQDKLDYIKELQSDNKKVLMVGDGLNDAGALSQSDVGIAVTEDTGSFTPACDAILEASRLNRLGDFLSYAKAGSKIIIASFIISFLYNVIGLSFAVSGMLSPIVAAILMPLSSVSVIVFTTVSTNYIAGKRGLLSL